MSLELYTKFDAGTKIWIPHCNSVWIGGIILENYQSKGVIKVLKDDGEITEFYVPKTSNSSNEASSDHQPHLRNPEILIGQNNLTSLSYLNEPEVLFNLQIRFCKRKEIYTYCGIVLIAINPYQDLPIYDLDIIEAYHSERSGVLDPHIYAVAENAYKKMSTFEENQSIIVSGESGAGKTVSAKYTMRYFATVGGSSNYRRTSSYGARSSIDPGHETQIERKVLSSNPLMEAMGNAKTIRNDNSSRFGKYVEIKFSNNYNKNRNYEIIGASMNTYLLEKSRVVSQNANERNYHIFYQLVKSMDCNSEIQELVKDTGLVNDAGYYVYLNKGNTINVDGANDTKEFMVTITSFLQLDIHKDQLKSIFEIIACILHLGNVSFVPDESLEGCMIDESNDHISHVARLLDISIDELKQWLCYRPIKTLQETLHKPLSVEEANYFKDALAKFIYGSLFTWIVQKINNSLHNGSFTKHKSSQSPSKSQQKPYKFIGVLDIYGFETFDENSFEQFCINFANEKLQQQFTMHVFKLEQEEYKREGLQWSFIEYYNNQPCIDLIESKLGLLDLLDEECKMVNGSDENWSKKIFSRHLKSSKSHFSRPKLSSRNCFVIEHFAGSVQYECEGFIEKNRDTVLEEHISLLRSSDNTLVQELFLDLNSMNSIVNQFGDSPTNNSASSVTNNKRTSIGRSARTLLNKKHDIARKMKKTVGNQFQHSLRQLITTLDGTTPHYVRCIKPNDSKQPFTFSSQRAVQQLRACGVLETIRLSAAGFPSRWTYAHFYQRYCILLSECAISGLPIQQACQTIVQTLIKETDHYRFGFNKLFFRSGQVAYLERKRGEKINWAATFIQKQVKCKMERNKYLSIQTFICKVQRICKCKLSKEKLIRLRQERAATRIQTYYRMFKTRCTFNKTKKSILTIQNWWRVNKASKEAYKQKMYSSTVICQSVIRSFVQQRRYRKILRGIILIQSHFRRRKAKEELRSLKIEARSINHFKQLNSGLENKIIELTQKLTEKEKNIVQQAFDFGKQKKLWLEDQKMQQLEMDKKYNTDLENLRAIISKLKNDLQKEMKNKSEMTKEIERVNLIKQRESKELESLKVEYQKEKLYWTQIIKEKDETIRHQSELIKNLTVTSDSSKEMKIKYQEVCRRLADVELKYNEANSELAELKTNLSKDSNGSIDSCSPNSLSFVDKTHTRSGVLLSGNNNSDTQSESPQYDTIYPNQPSQHSRQFISSNASSATNAHSYSTNRASGEGSNEKTGAEILNFQTKIRDISDENRLLQDRIKDLENFLLTLIQTEKYSESVEDSDGDNWENEHCSDVKLSDLKQQIIDLREDNQRLRASITSGRLGQLGDDILQRGIPSNLCGKDNEEIDEYQLAFMAQRQANTKLMEEIHFLKLKESSYEKEIVSVKREKDYLQKQLNKKDLQIKRGIEYILKMQRDQMTNSNQIEALLQQELLRVVHENNRLQQQLRRNNQRINRLELSLKYYARRLYLYETIGIVTDPNNIDQLIAHVEQFICDARQTNSLLNDESITKIGMIDLNMTEINIFLKTFVHDLSPSVCQTLRLYHTPAFVIFLISKKFDCFEEPEYFQTFLDKTVSEIKRKIKKSDDLELTMMWFSQLCCLLNLFRQYKTTGATLKRPPQRCKSSPSSSSTDNPSSDLETNEYEAEDWPAINPELGFISYDVSHIISQFESFTKIIYKKVIKYIRENLLTHSHCISAFLDYEGVNDVQPRETSLTTFLKTLELILKISKENHTILEIENRIFRHISNLINSYCVNELLMATRYCTLNKSIEIKYNISTFETWLRDNQLKNSGALECVNALREAVNLLQIISNHDITSNGLIEKPDFCQSLSVNQIMKLMRNFNGYDMGDVNHIQSSELDKLEAFLLNNKSTNNNRLLIPIPSDNEFNYDTEIDDDEFIKNKTLIPYHRNNQSLNSIVIPYNFNLTCFKILKKSDVPYFN